MDIKIDLDAKKIQEYISNAVINSVVGEEIKKCIEEKVGTMEYSFKCAIEKTVTGIIMDVIRTEINSTYTKQIISFVQKKITEEMVVELLEKMWESIGKERWLR